MSDYDNPSAADTDPKALMRERFEEADSYWSDKFEDCKADIRFAFVPGEQWDADMKARRGGRPCYEFNKTRPVVKSITNDMRQNDPGIKVVALQNGRQALAQTMNGVIKGIEAQSRASTAYDTAGFFAAAGGYGVIGIDTQYAADDVFEQDIVVREKRNPFSVLFDPAAKEFDKRDGRYAFEVISYTRAEFKARFPKAEPVDFSANNADRYGSWFTEKTIRVVRYWCKHPTKKTIYQLSDGRVLDQDDYDAIAPYLGQEGQGPNGETIPPLTLANQREVVYDRITVELASGKETLEGPTDWAGKFIPLVPVWGESVNVDGEEYFAGAARPIKDAQRLFNWDVCVGQEVMANQPRAPFLLTTKMVEGYEDEWKNLATNNAPALFYNPDEAQPGGPKREQPPMYPGGFFDSARFAADLIKSVSNVVDGPIQSRAASGKAIVAVEHQMDVGNFDYIDNLGRGKGFVGEILVDLVPRIYDTHRQVLILGEDGKEDYVELNQTVLGPDGKEQIINDLSQGKYAVTVTVGPSYATQRMEAVEALKQFASGPSPQISLVALHALLENMDAPGLKPVMDVLRKMLIAQGLLEPGEGDAPPPQQGPDPKDQADALLKAAQAEKAKAEAAQTKVETAQMVQHAPALALEHAARAEEAVTGAYTKDPTTPYFGPPNAGPPRGQPPQP